MAIIGLVKESNTKFDNKLALIGRRVRAARKERGYSQEKLSLLSGVSRSLVANLESGHSSVSIYSLFKIAEALDLEMEDIIHRE